MADNVSIAENIDALFSKLEKFLRSDTVVGHPISVGETTLVPIVTITFGCGTGTGSGSGGDNNGIDGSGSGLGAGARVTPNAILVIRNNEVTMLPVKGKNNLSNLVEMVPEILSKLDLKNMKKNASNHTDNEYKNKEHRNGETDEENHQDVNKHKENDIFNESNDNFKTQDNQQDIPLSY
ncbi:spore germination protein GerW family protein [Clostridium sp. DJ247]|uniref:GerW family sporulation protein n=1 Tax=Clostridium sp. DJ247 TaxID=2726188 RepID=UPI001626B7B6|nr:spore germination protein GerW family protein [Clostridium sp. DJ247]MBC2580497.1 sporulation protein [Clostridium sp. DJ247]